MFRDKFDFQHGTQTPKYQIDMTMACLLEGVSNFNEFILPDFGTFLYTFLRRIKAKIQT